MAKNDKKILQLETKKLESIMAMVREPDEVVKDQENDEEKS